MGLAEGGIEELQSERYEAMSVLGVEVTLVGVGAAELDVVVGGGLLSLAGDLGSAEEGGVLRDEGMAEVEHAGGVEARVDGESECERLEDFFDLLHRLARVGTLEDVADGREERRDLGRRHETREDLERVYALV